MLEKAIVSSKPRLKSDAPLALFLFVCGILASQRFSLPIISALTPLFILGGFIVFNINTARLATFAVCALLAIADLGGEAYFDTPSSLKYVIYFVSLACLALYFKFTPNKYTIITIFLSFLWTVLFIYNDTRVDLYTFFRDVSTIVLLILTVSATRIRSDKQFIDINLLLAFSIGVLISENVNFLLFYDISGGEYLSYNSSKFICLMPVLYFFIKARYTLALAFLPLTVIAVTALGARMVLLSFIVLTSFLIVGSERYRLRSVLVSIGALSLMLALSQLYDSELQKYRVLSIFTVFENGYSFEEILIRLDRVRFFENYMFFNQDFVRLFLGNGFGAGYDDVGGFFNFVLNDGGAFSPQELSERLYFRFHDSWIWFGYRLGLLPFLFCLFWIVKNIVKEQGAARLFSSLTFLALINASFSISGMIVMFLFALQVVKMRDSTANQGSN